ncbi:MAG: C-terminal binding protein [Treponema sp.]|nr:C-terminal binding protein [Treponema sp.]
MIKVVYFNIDDTLDYENGLLKEWGVDDVELIEIKDKTSGKFAEYLGDADGLVVEYEQVTDEVMGKCPKLKCVSVQSIGYNNLDVKAATERGVCLTNAPGFCAPEVALHTVGLLIDLVRKITFYDKSVRSGKWNPLEGYKTGRIAGMTFGMVFFGQIPKTMLPMLKALELKVLVYAPTKSGEYLAEYGCDKAETLDELLTKSDFVSLHCPLIKNVTYHLIGEPQLRKMKKTAYLLNTARGSVVDEQALVKALKEGWIKGAGIDVIEDETNETSGLFALNDNVVITPHAAFMSEDSFYAARRIALEQLVQRLHEKKIPSNLVNKNVVVDFSKD